MEFFGSLVGRIIFCLGLMVTVVGWVIGSVVGSGSGTTLPGVALMIVGAAIYRGASTKVCAQCTKRIQHSARQCKHCGSAQG